MDAKLGGSTVLSEAYGSGFLLVSKLEGEGELQ